jgi:acylphosphatase
MMSEPTQRLSALVYGRVQGVNFRYFTQQQAARLGLTGWVRNRADGTVEVVAEGPRPVLDDLTASLRRGPSAAAVADVRVSWGSATGEFTGFEVRW